VIKKDFYLNSLNEFFCPLLPYSYILTQAYLRPLITATCGYRHQAQENPFEGAQVEEGVDPLEEKVESNISAPT